MGIERAGPLEAARNALELSLQELWLDYVTLGGDLAAPEVYRFLAGRCSVGDGDYDRLALALNERFMLRKEPGPVPYAEDLVPECQALAGRPDERPPGGPASAH